MNKLAIITGVGGMDGTYLSRFLLDKGYQVVGVLRRSANSNDNRLRTLKGHPNLKLVYGDVTDAASIDRIISEYKPDELYALAANSFVQVSWNSPMHVIETNTIGILHCLESVRKYVRDCRVYIACSSEMYGNTAKITGYLNEESPMKPASPYGISKLAAYHLGRVYRESYDMFVSCGILFNHCDSLRAREFFTRKATHQLARVYWGLQQFVEFGNLQAKRDEGASRDYIEAMYLMLQHNNPDDFVIATGESHSCEEWIDLTCKFYSLDKEKIIKINKELFRPNEIDVLVGDASKAKELLDWKPKTSFEDLNKIMCTYDLYKQSPKVEFSSKADQYIF